MMVGVLAGGALVVSFLSGVPPRASASLSAPTGFLIVGSDPSVSTVERGMGEASLDVAGDTGTFHARLTVGITAYEVTVDPTGLRGVLLDRDVFGGTGIGPWFFPVAHAGIALFGQGRVRIGGQAVADHATVQVMALSAGFHSDDGAFRPLAAARELDTELMVLVSDLPAEAPVSFLSLGFDDVRMEVAGHEVPSQERVAVSGAPGPGSGVGGSGAFRPVIPEADATAAAPRTVTSSATLTGETMRGTGLPASTRIENDGRQTPALPGSPLPLNALEATPLPAANVPLNAGNAPPLLPGNASLNAAPSTTSFLRAPTPLNATPGVAASRATPLPAGIAPLNARAATPAMSLPSSTPAGPGGR